MTIARRNQFRLDVTSYYHCLTRCVRRAFLCGRDKDTGKRFDHRKKWIEEHLILLSEVFCVDISGFAVMSNHYHVVLHVNQHKAQELTDEAVLERWFRLYKGPVLLQRYAAGEELTDDELALVRETIGIWRSELTNISRFMGHLNQTISRRANREDGCRGRFWESRFKMQAILDVAALLRTLCYVDLNPLRAGLAITPEHSAHTSFRRRLNQKRSGLQPFRSGSVAEPASHGLCATLPISFQDYQQLLDYTGREVRQGKRGHIEDHLPPILVRLGYNANSWQSAQKGGGRWVSRALGGAEAVRNYCKALGQRWIWQTN